MLEIERCISLHHIDIGHTKLLTMDINIGDYPPIA